jgi:hypothetical protein
MVINKGLSLVNPYGKGSARKITFGESVNDTTSCAAIQTSFSIKIHCSFIASFDISPFNPKSSDVCWFIPHARQ